jgi:glutaredoxin 3
MYATGWCPYCAAARELLFGKQVAFTEIDVDKQHGARDEMVDRSGRRTVPQIFIGERHIGGYDDLAALERSGQLGQLLGRGADDARPDRDLQ